MGIFFPCLISFWFPRAYKKALLGNVGLFQMCSEIKGKGFCFFGAGIFESLLGQRMDVRVTPMGGLRCWWGSRWKYLLPPLQGESFGVLPSVCLKAEQLQGDLWCLFPWRWEGRWATVDTDFQTLLFGPKGHEDSRGYAPLILLWFQSCVIIKHTATECSQTLGADHR